MVVEELNRLLVTRGYVGSVGVVSPFREQANLIRDLAFKDSSLAPKLLRADFLAETVHKFQGDERDVMIFSPVVSRNVPPGAIVFLKKNGNLFNVAITRARAMLIVVGDRDAAARSDVSDQ
jgi:superfamily I DNA and/or RNA helicase